jgi:hypothetical protein
MIVLKNNTKKFAYNPKDDVTNKELARLLELFAAAPMGKIDVGLYIKEYNLDRHFNVSEVKENAT